MSSLDRDPGSRRLMDDYPGGDIRTNVRLAYARQGPLQVILSKYPKSDSGRNFVSSWFRNHPWLEWSPKTNRAYCFPCFLFQDESAEQRFVVQGYDNWRRATGKNSNLAKHAGGGTSKHSQNVRSLQLLLNQEAHIDTLFNTTSAAQRACHRLRLLKSFRTMTMYC